MCPRIGWAARLMAALTVLVGVGQAQTTVGVTVATTPSNAVIYVDGVRLAGTQIYSWIVGSTHTLSVESAYQSYGSGESRLTFSGWTVSSGTLADGSAHLQAVTVGSSSVVYTAVFVLEHRVDILINNGPTTNFLDATRTDVTALTDDNLADYASKTGYAVIDNVAACGSRTGIAASTYSWFANDAALTPSAYAYPGFVFKNWDNPPGPVSNGGSITITQPVQLRAVFGSARRVNVATLPVAGLKVIVDYTLTASKIDNCRAGWALTDTTPDTIWPALYGYCTQVQLCDGAKDFLPESTHVFSAPVSQRDSSNAIWVFDHWDFGDGISHGQNSEVTIPNESTLNTYTAYFVKGLNATFITLPTGLTLNIDGRTNWTNYIFEWGMGHTHTVSAPLEQVASNGRRYKFNSWSNGGAADQTITVADPDGLGTLRMAASYETLGQLVLSSSLGTTSFSVDGTACAATCTLDRSAGTTVTVTAPSKVTISDDTLAIFNGWSDGVSTASRSYTFTTAAASYKATYRYVHKLSLAIDPDGAATWTYTPAPETGTYFAAGTAVTVTATANLGYKFKRIDGAVSSAYNSVTVTMNGPLTLAAHFEKTAALALDAVVNAAGVTPVSGVAAGSLVAITGANLTEGSAYSAGSPLSQTLESLTVQVGDYLLPLVSVTPDKIVAELPGGLAAGHYTVKVKSALSTTTLTSTFTAVRNAPGLFRCAEATDDVPLAAAYHSDGKVVSDANPAKPGEELTLLGTGFGPTSPTALDGFAVPASALYAQVDPVKVLLGSDTITPKWAGAAPGRVGYGLVRFNVGDTTGVLERRSLVVTVNGQSSNTVVLSVQ
jgi:uncharacterized protein (TIGR03437 family)